MLFMFTKSQQIGNEVAAAVCNSKGWSFNFTSFSNKMVVEKTGRFSGSVDRRFHELYRDKEMAVKIELHKVDGQWVPISATARFIEPDEFYSVEDQQEWAGHKHEFRFQDFVRKSPFGGWTFKRSI